MRASATRRSVVMLLENNSYPRDVRPRREAESLVDAGYEVTVIAPRDPGQRRRERVGGVDVVRFRLPLSLPGAVGFVVEYAVATMALLAHGTIALLRGADVLHLHNPPDTLFPVAWVARALGRGVVFDLHDLTPELFAEKYDNRAVARLLRALERRSLRAAHQVLTVNESYRQAAAARGGLPSERIWIVRNVPRLEELSRSTTPRSGALADPRLVFVGEMAAQDNAVDLPSVVRRLIDRHGLERASLTIVGDGDERPAVEREVARLGLGAHVRFLGFVPHDDIPMLLADADICLEPARRGPLNDRCSMVKVAEYMGAGRPVVAFPLPEVRRMAGDSALYAETETLDEFSDLVAHLALDDELRQSLGSRGKELARQNTWEHAEATLLDAYRAL